MKTVPERPTADLVQTYLNRWQTLTKYVQQEQALNLLFQTLCPKNNDPVSVLLKVSALNDFYSTNIYDTHTVAAHILQLDCDDRIQAGDVSLVNEMARVTIGGKPRTLVSFASKYCNHHLQEPFPIFDSYVQKMLWHFRRVDRFARFQKPELRDYPRFVELIRCFQTHYSLGQFSLREIDIYLWLAGKGAFGTVQQSKGKSKRDKHSL